MTGTFDWRRALVLTHRWLGIAGGLLVVLWFASGIVMVYARMPELSAAERLEGLPPLDLSTLAVDPGTAAALASSPGRSLRVGMLEGRPVYRFASGVVYGDTGERLDGVERESALRIAAAFGGSRTASPEYDGYLTEPDQWTLQSRGSLPLHRISLGDAAGTRLYVSERGGEVVMETTARERRWAYAGAVLHWLYFTPFRVHTGLWVQTVIWLSVLGCALTLSGLVWGVWRFSWRRRENGRSPYQGLLRWHHYSGLVFGFFTFTWILSGGLSMDPWSWHPGTAPTAAQRSAVTGGAVTPGGFSADGLRRAADALVTGEPVKELGFLRFDGEQYAVAAPGGLMASAASPGGRPLARFADEAMEAAARRAMPGVPIVDEAWLSEPDSYYYGRGGSVPLPVLRVRYADPPRTWLYFDPARGLVRKEERLTRLNRWLYRGFHSLDFPFLYGSRPLWDVVVIVLSLGGLALAATTLQPGWARLLRHLARLWS